MAKEPVDRGDYPATAAKVVRLELSKDLTRPIDVLSQRMAGRDLRSLTTASFSWTVAGHV